MRTWGSSGSGSGVTSYAGLSDKATVDLPTVNTPLATALGLLAPRANPTLTGTVTVPTNTYTGLTTAAVNQVTLAAALAASGRLYSGTGSPNGVVTGVSGDGYVRVDTPFAGVLYLCSGGTTWALAQTSTTWAARPSASSNSGAVITVSDWNADFFSDGTNWTPLGKRLTIDQFVATSYPSRTTGTGAVVNMRSTSVPIGLLYAGCKLHAQWKVEWAGTSASTKTLVFDDTGGQFWLNSTGLLAGIKEHSDFKTVCFGASNLAFALPSGQTADATVAAGLAAAPQTVTGVNYFTTATSWRIRSNTASDDAFQLLDWEIFITYP
jgi:hypothetical protein